MKNFGILLFALAILLTRLALVSENTGDLPKFSPPSKLISFLSDCEENLSEEDDDHLSIDFLLPVFFQPAVGDHLLSLEHSPNAYPNTTSKRLYCLYQVYRI